MCALAQRSYPDKNARSRGKATFVNRLQFAKETEFRVKNRQIHSRLCAGKLRRLSEVFSKPALLANSSNTALNAHRNINNVFIATTPCLVRSEAKEHKQVTAAITFSLVQRPGPAEPTHSLAATRTIFRFLKIRHPSPKASPGDVGGGWSVFLTGFQQSTGRALRLLSIRYRCRPGLRPPLLLAC